MAIERLSVAKQFWRESGYSHLQRYLFALERVRGRVLDVACGVGYGSYLLGVGTNVVQGVDLSAEAIAEARAEHIRPNVSFHLGALDSLPADTPLFDAAVSLETIEHIPDPTIFLAEVRRRLKPGGLLVVSAPNILQHTRAVPPVPNAFHLSEPTYADLHTWLNKDFCVLEEWEQTRLVGPHYDETNALSRSGAALGQLKVIRWMAAVELGLRRLLGKDLPPVAPIVNHTDALAAETAIIPLLPARREIAHTFVFVAQTKS